MTENIARLCMVCQHVLDDDEWVERTIYEQIHTEKVMYSHGVCESDNCKNAFKAYCIGDFEGAMYHKNRGKDEKEQAGQEGCEAVQPQTNHKV